MANSKRSKKLGCLTLGLGTGAFLVGAFLWWRRRADRRTIQRTFWDVVYDRLAWLYDSVDWFTGNTTHRLRRRALRYMPPEGSRVLELGVGTGRLHRELAARYDMAGLDRAEGMVAITRRRLAAHGLTSDLQVGDVTALPWPDDAFDAVVSTFVFSAIPDADAAMDEMVRVTRPGGRVIIVDAGEARDHNAVAHWLAQLWELFGDYIRDEVPLMEARGLITQREEYGPWGSVHVTVGTRPVKLA
jgi:demethylmenaquinone methyltransferase/2-methoxy-6-polyprenyl-1,4-benzoquinol methylase